MYSVVRPTGFRVSVLSLVSYYLMYLFGFEELETGEWFAGINKVEGGGYSGVG